ncbi:MAG: hypothetical protein ABSE95_10935 [Thermodesulfobacteriota bacterium]|jgi:hypothetical protein
MNEIFKTKLEILRENYAQKTGYPFNYFYCPILYKDENKPLCMGHIVNLAFPNSARAWTVQREDIDNFYGSKFESEFTLLQHSRKFSPDEILRDKQLSKSIKPKILLNSNPIDYYYTEGNIPNYFSPVIIENDEQTTKIALKMSAEEVLSEIDGNWKIDISKDIRLPALVSLIKSAHLTLFDMLGYDYALSSGGNFVGHEILGKFYEYNKNKSKSEVLKNALPFFRNFAHMVRPLTSNRLGFQGTISDNQLLVCRDVNNNIWALIVFIRTDQNLHAVLIPIFEEIETIPKFLSFLESEKDTLEVNFCRFKITNWEISKKSIKLTWPKTGILYPEMYE